MMHHKKRSNSNSNESNKKQYIMKKLSMLFIALAVVVLPACDVLDVEPYHSIPADQAIVTMADVESAINGVYSSLQGAGYYGRNYLAAGDLTADNLTWTGTTAGYNQMNNNSILSDNVIVEGIWASIYRTISRANVVIQAIPNVEELTDDQANAYLAELRFLRAMGHFDLVRLFGPVPIRLAPATADDDDLNVPRMPKEDVYDAIFADLNFARQHIRPNVTQGLASRAAVLGLMARAKLYYHGMVSENSTFLEEAMSLSTQVIEDNLSLTPDFAQLFEQGNNTESIFEVAFGEQDRNRLAEYFFPTSLSGRREFSPTEKLYDTYPANDARRDASIAMDGTNLYAIKYSDIETGTDNVYVLRLAEMYLIRAEARVLLETQLDMARDDINTVRQRAGLTPVTTTNPETLTALIAKTRQLEFAFEGHRWFDLVRTGMAIEELENVTEECQTLFPIPLGELLTNFHPDMYQNDCY